MHLYARDFSRAIKPFDAFGLLRLFVCAACLFVTDKNLSKQCQLFYLCEIDLWTELYLTSLYVRFFCICYANVVDDNGIQCSSDSNVYNNDVFQK